MLRDLGGRAIQALVVAFVVTSLAFLLVHALPGTAASGVESDPDLVAAQDRLRATYGLDRPLAEQYGVMIGHFARGDLGESYVERRPVRDIVVAAMGRSMLLVTPALALGVLLGVVVGTWQAARLGTVREMVTGGGTLVVTSVPPLVIALVIGDLFAIRLHWFPATGTTSAAAEGGVASIGDVAWHLTLPTVTIALAVTALVARYQRVLAADALGEEFVRAARARGAPRRTILWRHVVRRTAPAIIAVVGLLAPAITGGAAVVEHVFGWSGAGATLIAAVARRDYPVVVPLVAVASLTVAFASALADVAAGWLDPARRNAA